MAKTQLNMELIYKGKVLDYIKSGSGVFKNNWYLGSNKHLLWQILDPSFPDKVKLISQKNNNFIMNLIPKAQVECKQDGKSVTKEQLTASGLLKGNQLTLQNNMTGTVTLSPDWQINYRFIEPYVHVLTEEERRIVAQYSRRAERSPQEKAGTTLILVFLFITLAILVVYDLVLKPDLMKQYTLDAGMASYSMGQRIEPRGDQMPPQSQIDEDAAAKAAAEAAAKAAAEAAAKAAAEATKPTTTAKPTQPKKPTTTTTTPTGTTGTTTTGGSTASRFGSFDPSATVRNPVAITETRSFVVTTPGATASGSGTTGGGGKPSGIAGTAGGISSTFDPHAVSNYKPSDLAGASTAPGGKGSTTTRPTGNVDVVADINKAQIAQLNKPVAQTGPERQLIATISAQAPAVTENAIASAPEEQRTGYQSIKNYVGGRRAQLINPIRKYTAIEKATGTVDIRILGRDGRVQTAEVIPTSGNLPEDYLAEIKRIVMGWNIPQHRGPFNYKFTIRVS